MTLINTVSPESARGLVKKGYDHFLERGVRIPAPFLLMSVSPTLFNLMMQRNRYYSAHPTLSFELLAHIRYFVSKRLDFGFCRNHNQQLLEKQGLAQADFERMDLDPDQSILLDNEKQLLTFVLQAMDEPGTTTPEDISRLHKAGWEDRDIYDALAQGVGMIDHNIIMKVFQADIPDTGQCRQESGEQ